jgi:alpha-L-rhamnosidase
VKHFAILLAIIQPLCFPPIARSASLQPAGLRCEYLQDPLGIDVVKPRLSWSFNPIDTPRGVSQSSYQILVASSRPKIDLNEGDLWDSGRVASDKSVHITYGGTELPSRAECYWKVRVWDGEGSVSDWSPPARWTMGLLRSADWQGKWIGTSAGTGPDQVTPWFRKAFSIRSRPRSSYVYVASIGYHDLFVNGRKVGDAVLSPSVSNLAHRVRYVTYDVSGLLVPGENCIGIWLGNGWASHPEYKLTGGARFLLQMETALEDGSRVVVLSDSSWKTHASPLTGIGHWKAREFGGERYDARQEMPGWSTADFKDSDWEPVRVFGQHTQALSAEMIEPNRLVRAVEPASIQQRPDGSVRVDMGRSYTGWFEIALRGARGHEIALEYSERESEACSYSQRDVYICSGKGNERFQSRFNYHAFRWVTIRNLGYSPAKKDMAGYLIRTDFRPAATFSSSNPLLNRLHDAMSWTYESLALGGYLVDCPHRERLGYGGDAHATMETGMSQFRTEALYTKWLQDWRDSQASDGEMPHTAPQMDGGGGPAWGGICVVLPWEFYRRYGDIRILETSYASARKWLEFLESKSSGDLLRPFTSFSTPGQPIWSFLGDWVAPGRGQEPAERVDERSTLFFNNCYWILNLRIAADWADVLGHADDARQYRARAEQVSAQAHRTFYDASRKTYANGEQTYLVFALAAGVVPEELRSEVLGRLEERIKSDDKGHINAGMHGTWLLYRYLGSIARDDLLAAMMLQQTYPSWGYMLDQGATTIWEEWNGNNSRLHSTLMGAGQWFTEDLAGIRPGKASPGYKHFILCPAVVAGLDAATATLQSPYGEIRSEWRSANGEFHWRLRIPANTTATVFVPASSADAVTEGGQPASGAAGIRFLRTEKGRAVFEAGSGTYDFTALLTK